MKKKRDLNKIIKFRREKRINMGEKLKILNEEREKE